MTTIDLPELLLAAFGIDVTEGDAYQHVIDVRTQDERDGAAVRQLLAATAAIGWRMGSLDHTSYGEQQWRVFAHGPRTAPECPCPQRHIHKEAAPYAVGRGDTLAQAADACRLALPGSDDADSTTP